MATLALAGCASVPGDRSYFEDQETKLIETGRFKVDRVARNAPYTSADLVRNFHWIAFGSEYEIQNGRYVASPHVDGESLSRWVQPIRYSLSGRVTDVDLEQTARTALRLADLIGLPITPAEPGEETSLEIQFLSGKDRERLVTEFKGPRADSPLAELFLTWAAAPTWPCAGEFYYRDAPHPEAHQISFAIIYIRDELAGLYRQSCIEEELSQVLGLARDHPLVRPSVFNDDEEFALLTLHDEQLLRVLYDPRLEPGMTPNVAMPLVREIVNGLRPGS